MDRKTTTKLLSDLLIRDILMGKYWSSEVTFNYGRVGECRIDFVSFTPVNQSTSGIERGTFSTYEVKSCLEDYRSKNGHNFTMDKNYYVMPMEVYKKIVRELPHNVGVYCPIPNSKSKHDEFENPTLLEDLQEKRTTMTCIKSAHQKDRDISNSVALFCMLRSGKT